MLVESIKLLKREHYDQWLIYIVLCTVIDYFNRVYNEEFDLIVIGGGRASNLALKLPIKIKKVALIEKSKLGGTCPNRGCVPSKLFDWICTCCKSYKKNLKRHFYWC